MVRSEIVFYLNGVRHQVSGPSLFMMTARYLREHLGLTGTKIVCEEGDCGACTTLISNIHEQTSEEMKFKSIDCCIYPVYALDGCHLLTVEGLKDGNELHPAQQSMVDHFGSQCGFCTPGMVCSMAAMVEECHENKSPITEKKARNYMTGNLCRCTGYEPILTAAKAIDLKKSPWLKQRYHSPDLLKDLKESVKKSLIVETSDFQLYMPTTLREALELKNKFPKARISAGFTDLGVLQNKGKFEPQILLSLQHITDLYRLERKSSFLEIGARVTLTQLEKWVETESPEFGRLLHIFASPQIKNNATLVGNVVNASPIGDTIPYLMVADAVVIAESIQGQREIPLDHFYLGYKKLDLKDSEIVTGIKIPANSLSASTKLYKVSTRKDLDISTVTFAASIQLNARKVAFVRFALGGVGPTVLRMKDLEKEWTGSGFDKSLVANAIQKLPQFITPLSDVRGSKEYRLQLCANLFKKFFHDISSEVRL